MNLARNPSIRPSCASLKALELKNCIQIGFRSFEHLKQAHARLFRVGLCEDNDLMAIFVDYYSQYGYTHYSKLIFNHTKDPTIFLFNAIIRGLVSYGFSEESIQYYQIMRAKGLLPNDNTFPFVLKACARTSDNQLGLKIHSLVVKLGCDVNVYVSTSLLSMYANCEDVYNARKVFDIMPNKNIFSWTAMISGYLNDGQFHEAVRLFKSIIENGLRPDGYTIVKILRACAELGELEFGDWIHQYLILNGIRKDMAVNIALIDMYAKCGCMDKARDVFDQMPKKDAVSSSVVIQGYVANGFAKEAIDVFIEMERENVKPDSIVLIGVLTACTRLGALDLGKQVISSLKREQLLNNLVLATTVVDMYAKCGNLNMAWNTFQEIKHKDVVVWNAAISGLCIYGHVKVAFGLFAQMEKLGFQPNGNTFLALLSGCNHAGLVDEGWRYFDSMERIYFVTPTIEHYGCMVDLLSRQGLLDKAYHFIQSMPIEPNVVVWGALLSGCRLYKNTQHPFG